MHHHNTLHENHDLIHQIQVTDLVFVCYHCHYHCYWYCYWYWYWYCPAATLLDPLAIFLSRVARKLNLAFPPPGFSPELASDSDSDLLRAAGVLALSLADLSSSPSCCRGALDAPGSVKEVLEHTKHLYTCDNNTHTHTHTVISNYTYTLTRHTSQHYSLYYSYSLLATHYATLHYTTHYTTLLTTPTHYTTLHYSPLHS